MRLLALGHRGDSAAQSAPGWVSGSSWGSQTHPDARPVPQVRIWEIPEGGLKRNMTEAVLELYGHSRRVGLVEWHPTTNNILFSAGYDYKVSPAPLGCCPGLPLQRLSLLVTRVGVTCVQAGQDPAGWNKMTHRVCSRQYLPSCKGLAPSLKDYCNFAQAAAAGRPWEMEGGSVRDEGAISAKIGDIKMPEADVEVAAGVGGLQEWRCQGSLPASHRSSSGTWTLGSR